MTMLNQNFSMWAGNTRYLSVSVTEQDGETPKDLTDAHIVWILREYGSAENILVKETSAEATPLGGLMINDPPTAGIFTIFLYPEDTQDLSGVYYHQADVTNQHGEVSTVLTGSAVIDNVLDITPPEPEFGWENVNHTVQVHGEYIYIVLNEDLEDNHEYRIVMPKTTKAMDGSSLGSDYILEFTSRYYPLLASPNMVRLDLGQYMTDVNEDYMYRYIRENSMAIMSITPREDIDWDDPPFEFKQYVRFKTIYDMILGTYMRMASGGGKSVKLGQLTVDYRDSQSQAEMLRFLKDLLEPWYSLCMGLKRAKGIRTVTKGTFGRSSDGTYPFPRGFESPWT